MMISLQKPITARQKVQLEVLDNMIAEVEEPAMKNMLDTNIKLRVASAVKSQQLGTKSVVQD